MTFQMHSYYCVFLFQTNKLVINFGNGKIENLKDCVQRKRIQYIIYWLPM